MEIFVFSSSRKIKDYFKIAQNTKQYSLPQFIPREELKKRSKEISPGSLIYLDLNGMEDTEISSYLRLLDRNKNIFYGLIDPVNKIKDPSGIFHNGAVDYLGRTAIQEGISGKRLKALIHYIQELKRELPADEPEKRSVNYLPSGKDWKGVIPGKEYTFCFMFIELDDTEEMEKKYGLKNLSIALQSFRNFIENSVRQYQGRLWIWSRFGGIVLFPFDGTECPQLKCSFRLAFFKHLYDIEESLFPNFLSFRVALNIGNIVYSQKNTGNIISDSLNFIFHLGQNFAIPGKFYVTEEVLNLGHPVLRSFFYEVKIFEGRRIFQMSIPSNGIIYES